jgi:hypothetical protein
MITRPRRRSRDRRGFQPASPSIQIDASFDVIDFDNPGGDETAIVTIRADQPIIANAIPEDVIVRSAADPVQFVNCIGVVRVSLDTVELHFPNAFPDTALVASSDLLNVPARTDDLRTYSGGYLDASQRTMEPVGV